VIDKWANEKFGYVAWATHGSDVEAISVISSSQTSQIQNGGQAFVFCGACNNGVPSSTNNLAFSMLKNCAIGVVAASQPSFDNYPEEATTKFEEATGNNGMSFEFAYSMIIDSVSSGEALDRARKHGEQGIFNLYGDPSLGLYTCKTGATEIASNSIRNPNAFSIVQGAAHLKVEFGSPVSGTISITSLMGRTISSLQVDNCMTAEMKNAANLSSGMYCVSFKNSRSGSVYNRRLVIN